MNNGGGDGTSCFRIKIRTDATKLTHVRITRFRQCRDLVRESEIFIKDEAKITSRVSGINRSVMCFSKFRFSGVKSQHTQNVSLERHNSCVPVTA